MQLAFACGNSISFTSNDMKLSKRQKVCVAVFAVASAGLVVDRTFLRSGTTSPSETSAAPVQVSSQISPETPPAAANLPEKPVRESVGERLERLSSSRELVLASVQDAFSLSETWMADYRRQANPEAHLTPAERFAKDHELKAVVVSGDASIAVVDEKCLFLEQELDGFRLISVGERSATFESGGQRVVLKLKKGG